MNKLIGLIIFLILGCSVRNQNFTSPIKCIEGINLFPRADSLGNIVVYDTAKVKIYSYGKLRLYELEYLYLLIDQEKKFSKKKNTHFIGFNVDSSFGYDFDENKSPFKNKVNKDSAFRREWIVSNRIYPIISKNLSKVISTFENKDSGTVLVTYSILNKVDSTSLGILNLHFKKHFLSTEITLSKELDSLYNMKLYKYEIQSNPQNGDSKKGKLGGYTISVFLREVFDFDEKRVMKYFKDI